MRVFGQREKKDMPVPDEHVEEFMKRSVSISLDYINGYAPTLVDISASHDPASFFPPLFSCGPARWYEGSFDAAIRVLL
jgi:hypothetical protein